MDENRIWAALGPGGFDRVVAAFYGKVKEDEVLGPLYPENDWEGAEKRLAGFLKFRFGGEMDYVEERGHPRLRMRHMPFRIGPRERDRWLELMGGALEESGVDGEVREPLMDFFTQVAEFMRNE